jgi:hypothetical protein
VESVAVALANGGDVTAVNHANDSAVLAAALLGYDRVIRQLALAGATVDLKSGHGIAALDQIVARAGASLRSPDRVNRGPSARTVELLRSLSGTP